MNDHKHSLFLHACKLALQENSDEYSATIAADIYLNFILSNTNLTLPTLKEG